MKILRMKATFGCLDEAELILQPGVNDLILPNGYGKSTWAAFVLAMFYGIDTTQRAAKDRLPEKVRYAPWNGKAMEGILELDMEGTTVVLQRTSARGRPMGQLRVYEKETGVALSEVTAENCGMYFLGLERSVFQRSAFLRGEELAVSQDAALSRRLENLAVGGEGGESDLQAAERLKQWKNRIRYHRTGLLPEVEAQLAQVEEHLARQEQAESTRQTLCQTVELLQTQQSQAESALAQAEKALAEASMPKKLSLWLGWLCLCLAGGLAVWKGLWALLPGGAGLGLLLWYLGKTKTARRRRQELERQARQARAACEAVDAHGKTAALRRELETMETVDRGQLMEQWTALAQRRQSLLQQEQALSLAQEALEFAKAQQQRVYAPRLTKLAGEYLTKLTDGRYTGLVLERDLSLQVLEGESGLARPLAALSTGTRDQAWLALRLAMTKLLLPKDMPIWLDDALLTFDGDRTAAAMAVLAQERRQVILMRCK